MNCKKLIYTPFFYVTCVIILGMLAEAQESQHIQWITPTEAKKNMSQLIPAGVDHGGMTIYVARLGGWLPGKAMIISEAFLGYFAINGTKHQVGAFELLVVPINTTTWLPSPTDEIQPVKNSIVSGSDLVTGETLYICRGRRHKDTLMVGKLVPSRKICFIPHYGEEQVSDYEVLVINAFGESIGMSNAEEYQKLSLINHNEHRARHYANPLILSDDLNTRAVRCAKYYAAKKGNVDHKCPYKNGAGENLWASWGGLPSLESSANGSVSSWYKESAKHDYDQDYQSGTGHFTQIVWKSSTQYGFGAYTVGRYTAGVALYSPHGNVIGAFRQNVQKP